MTPPAPQHPAPHRRSRGRALVAIAVLFGLFLMHGMSAGADAACANEPVTATASASGHLATSATATAVGAHNASDAASIERCCGDAMMGSCVPLGQRGAGALLAILLLALAWASGPRPAPADGLLSAARRARRTRTGIAPLALTGVCRT